MKLSHMHAPSQYFQFTDDIRATMLMMTAKQERNTLWDHKKRPNVTLLFGEMRLVREFQCKFIFYICGAIKFWFGVLYVWDETFSRMFFRLQTRANLAYEKSYVRLRSSIIIWKVERYPCDDIHESVWQNIETLNNFVATLHGNDDDFPFDFVHVDIRSNPWLRIQMENA